MEILVNEINKIENDTFNNLPENFWYLNYLILMVNMRKIDENTFNGLKNLEKLTIFSRYGTKMYINPKVFNQLPNLKAVTIKCILFIHY